MKGSLTATSSTSGHWSATLATSLPIRPKPAAPSKKIHQKSTQENSRRRRKPDQIGDPNSPLMPILMGAAENTEIQQKQNKSQQNRHRKQSNTASRCGKRRGYPWGKTGAETDGGGFESRSRIGDGDAISESGGEGLYSGFSVSVVGPAKRRGLRVAFGFCYREWVGVVDDRVGSEGGAAMGSRRFLWVRVWDWKPLDSCWIWLR